MTRRVFVVNEPLQRDLASREMTRKIDLRPAETYGELVFLSAPGNPPRDPAFSVQVMRERLGCAQRGDYLLAVGHPFLICLAAALMAHQLDGEFTVLLWDRVTQTYSPIKAELWSEKEVA